MPLYLFEGKLLVDEGKLAISEDCCCVSCPCCIGVFDGFQLSVEGVGDVATIKGIVCVVTRILTPLPSLIILAAVITIIFGGVRLMTAGANPKAVGAAWQTIMWAVVGIILLSVAWLVLVAIQKFTGANVTEFGFPTPTSPPSAPH